MNNISKYKNQFINEVERFLGGYGFSNEENRYVLARTIPGPSQQMIINGQSFITKSPDISLLFIVELIGTGSIDHMDERGQEEFELIRYEVEQSGQKQFEHNECIYYSEPEMFINLTKIIFKI